MATNFGQLAFFSESKNQLSKRTDLSERSVTVASSVVGGFFAAFFSLPFDLIKTRLQRGKGPSGQSYKGVFDCAVKIVKDEGPMRFYRGFSTYVSTCASTDEGRREFIMPMPSCSSLTCAMQCQFLRIAPHSVITLIVADNVNALIRRS